MGLVGQGQLYRLFFHHRSSEYGLTRQQHIRSLMELSQLAESTPHEQLIDPATDASRVKSGHDQWLVVVGICTHLGCVPLGNKPTDPRGEWGGWFCPCHGSQYDTSGRVRHGPAPLNLAVPPYGFVSDSKIKIG